jgi:uncharacterized protein with ATP-grasp and redox domains
VGGHSFDERRVKKDFASILKEAVFGDVEGAKAALEKYKKIFYLLDNAGEVVIDKFVIDAFEDMRKDVKVSPKSSPVINDVTAEELDGLGFDSEKIVSSGAFVGVSLKEAPKEFIDLLFDPDYLIIAKGMGNYETLSEFEDKLKGRLIYIFRAKCLSVADSVSVERGTLVISLA